MLRWFCHRLKKPKDERGFTLIELLVVIVIIGILAAIAIPTFMSQRTRAFDADAQSTARNAATAAKTYFVDNNTYAGMDEADLNAIEPSLPDAANAAPYSVYTVAPSQNGRDFTITVRHQQGDTTYVSTDAGTREQ